MQKGHDAPAPYETSEAEELPEVSGEDDGPAAHPLTNARLSEISRLTNLLADRVLNARLQDSSVEDTDIQALLKASLLLNEYGHEAPPLLDRLIQKLRAETAEHEVQ